MNMSLNFFLSYLPCILYIVHAILTQNFPCLLNLTGIISKIPIKFLLMNSKSSRFEDLESTQNVISNYDLTAIEELDPAIADGFKVVFDKELPIELRYPFLPSLSPKTPR